MALIQLGGGVTDIRGSIGGTTFARSAAGNYARARKKPVNPRSALQATRRAQLSQLSTYWSKTCTEVQRQGWRDYAAGTTWTNRLGQTIEINGIAAFLRTNSMKLIAVQAIQPAAPVSLGQGGQCTIAFSASEATNQLSFGEPSAPWDKDVDLDLVIVFSHQPTSPGRIAAAKVSRWINFLLGNSVTPLEFPLLRADLWTLLEGDQKTMAWRHMDELGRVSALSSTQFAVGA